MSDWIDTLLLGGYVIFEKGYYFITPRENVKKKTVTIPATVSSS